MWSPHDPRLTSVAMATLLPAGMTYFCYDTPATNLSRRSMLAGERGEARIGVGEVEWDRLERVGVGFVPLVGSLQGGRCRGRVDAWCGGTIAGCSVRWWYIHKRCLT